jgi:hypothetical protein
MCVVIDHPLEPFSWSEFEQDIELCSYPVELCGAGRMADRGPIFPAPLGASGLPELGALRTLHPYVGKLYLKVV